MEKTRIYDGALLCHTANCCPVAEYDAQGQTVTIHDPAKPESGSFTMSLDEWNLLVANAKPVK